MRTARTLLALLAALAVLPVSSHAQQRPVVVELFTSQGCSSCPPADRFLSELARDRADVLALGFHITYWDNLGWRDPYALPAATERQRRYAELLPSGEVYTPEMVIGGRRDVVGSDREAARAAIAAAASAPAGPALHVAPAKDGKLAIEVGAGAGRATLWVIGYDREHRTSVGRGENAGRSLLEADIVRELAAAGQWRGTPLRLEASVPAGERTAVLLQAEDGAILAAARAEPPPGS